ncbi:MAG: hypothetical protein K8I00_00445 [Candidatus Omnitrophica bacterium]|nr:hypothetical protein [Candidatus Omnitrophota bacterium]
MNALRVVIMVMALTTALCGRVYADVEEQVLGPVNASGSYVVSPKGANVAYVGMKGTRLFVSYNGTEGPVFDELFTPTGQNYYCPQKAAAYKGTEGGMQGGITPVIFSQDGQHYAYAGRQGEEYVVIHDGKEIARGPRASLSLSYGALTITPKGRQVYWIETKREGNANATWRMMVNGKPGPYSGNQTMKVVFSPDESRYAYVAVRTDDAQKTMLVVDGKDAGYVGRDPVFTADNQKLLSLSVQTTANPKAALLVNGKPALTANSLGKIFPSPVGGRYAVIVQTKLDSRNMGINTLFIDGKAVPGTDGVQTMWWSADGTHYAAACTNAAANSMFMVVDGKPQTEYQTVTTDKVFWTPDGSHFMYTIVSAGRQFLVIDGEEHPVEYLIGKEAVTMAPSGGHYAYGTRDGMNRNFSMVIDGQQVLPQGVYPYDAPVFSADGSRYGYFVGPVGRNEMTGVVVDGVIQPGVAPRNFGGWMPSDLSAPTVVFSPDGKQVVYYGGTGQPDGSGIYVNGKLGFAVSRSVFYPAFTPDSQHLFWVSDEPAAVPGQQPPTVIYADGQKLLSANGYFFRGTQLWDMDVNGVVTFLAQDGDQIKRYRISAPAEYNVAKMAGDFESNRAKMIADAQAAKQKAEEEATAAKAQAQADAEAAAAKKKADYEAAVAKKKADYEAAVAAKQAAYAEAVAAKQKAREEAIKAKQLYVLNAQRARKGLPPLTELPE